MTNITLQAREHVTYRRQCDVLALGINDVICDLLAQIQMRHF